MPNRRLQPILNFLPQKVNSKRLALVGFFVAAMLILAFGIHFALGNNALGADFYIYWTAGRAAILEKANPYSPEVTQQIQMGIYGRPARPGEDQVAFAYPAYSLWLIAPVFLLNFGYAQSFWLAINLLALISLAFYLFPRAPRWMLLTLPLFYPMAFALILGNFNLPVGLILLAFFGILEIKRSKRGTEQIILGIFLAWATIKPQLVWFFFIFGAILVLRYRLWPLAVSFVSAAVVMLGLTFAFVPGWFPQWIQRLQNYTTYIEAKSFVTTGLEKFFPFFTAAKITNLLLGVALLLSVILLLNWWKQIPKDPGMQTSISPLSTLSILAWIGFISYIFHPFGKSYEQITLMIPFFFWAGLNFKRQPKAVPLFWFSGLALSWISLYFNLNKTFPNAIYDWMVAFFFIWLVYLGVSEQKNLKPSI